VVKKKKPPLLKPLLPPWKRRLPLLPPWKPPLLPPLMLLLPPLMLLLLPLTLLLLLLPLLVTNPTSRLKSRPSGRLFLFLVYFSNFSNSP
jgi:hypothetical protein